MMVAQDRRLPVAAASARTPESKTVRRMEREPTPSSVTSPSPCPPWSGLCCPRARPAR